MSTAYFILFTVYTTIVVSLIWARLRFFEVSDRSSRVGSYFYDPAVAAQMLCTYYYILYGETKPIVPVWIAIIFYCISLALFWWAIITAKRLNFAYGTHVGIIITTGPYSIFRHPFYVSYILIWSISSLLFNSIVLWITLLFLIAFYLTAARLEERAIMEGRYAQAYTSYKSQTGMFFPRMNQWTSWLLRLLRTKKA